MSSNIRDRIRSFDFDESSSYDLAVLLEQVFLYQGRSGETPLVIARDVLDEYEKSVRARALPEFHTKTNERLRDLRSTLVQFETSLSDLEKAVSVRGSSR